MIAGDENRGPPKRDPLEDTGTGGCIDIHAQPHLFTRPGNLYIPRINKRPGRGFAGHIDDYSM